ncbi:MAG TPA: hypothetical protein VEA41_10485 [Salinarimonas sp.]|nr:hypothetical protein [Salinarimonas sp.]
MSEHDFDRRMGVCRKCRRHAREIIGWACAPIPVNDGVGEIKLEPNAVMREAARRYAELVGQRLELQARAMARQLAAHSPETPADGATAPNHAKPEDGDSRDGPRRMPPEPRDKPSHSVPSIGHALRQVNATPPLVGLANRHMAGRGE